MTTKRTSEKSEKSQVNPLPDIETINRLRQILHHNPRDLLLFDLATQTGASIKYLIRLKVHDLFDLSVKAPLPDIRLSKKQKSVGVFNQQCYRTFQLYLKMKNPAQNDFLFPSRKGGKALNLNSVSHIIKKWFVHAQIENLSGARSLKKTWECFYRSDNQFKSSIDEKFDPILTLQPVETKTLQENVYQELSQAIFSGRLPPGRKIVVEKIANRLQVSHMPVRDALYRLQAAGFISISRKKGIIVKELSPDNLEEITTIRLALEPIIARKAAVNPSNTTLKRLEELHKAYLSYNKDKPDIEYFLSINRKFHYTIFLEGNMPILLSIIDQLWGRISPYFHYLMRTKKYSDTKLWFKLHENIFNAMKAKEPEEVVKHLKIDLTQAAQELRDMFDRERK